MKQYKLVSSFHIHAMWTSDNWKVSPLFSNFDRCHTRTHTHSQSESIIIRTRNRQNLRIMHACGCARAFTVYTQACKCVHLSHTVVRVYIAYCLPSLISKCICWLLNTWNGQYNQQSSQKKLEIRFNDMPNFNGTQWSSIECCCFFFSFNFRKEYRRSIDHIFIF